MATASSCWSAAARRDKPGWPPTATAGEARQASSAIAGSSARLSSATRSGGVTDGASQAVTSPRRAPSAVSRRRRPACGWESSSASQAASSNARSSPGSTTRPPGMRDTTRSKRATAGMPPVDPAASVGYSGGWSAQARACASSRATWRAAGFIRRLSASHAGQDVVTISRKRSVMPQCWA